MERIIECIPNFSEGRDRTIIDRIAASMAAVEGVKVLDVDPGASTNRTVITLAGAPEAVAEAAFQGVRTAAQLIDMRKHHGEHPRMGATDVVPFVPICGVTVAECVELARQLGQRVGSELGIPVYLYEYAATEPKRKSLANIRAGEYEGFQDKITRPEWKPDFGPARFNPTAGQTVIGVREFLIAYNVNLNTASVRRANAVAFDIREAGRVQRAGDAATGEIVRDEKGEPQRIPGKLKHCRAIGWYIEEYRIAQVSMNLTNIHETPLHLAFEAASESAQSRGMRVTGSELVGLVPLDSLLKAGRHFLRKQNRSTGVSDAELVHIAVKSMGLDELGPFNIEQKVIEYNLERGEKRLANLSLKQFAQQVANEHPAPGGGSVSAYLGVVGAALGAMDANVSANKRGWDNRVAEFSEAAEQLQNAVRALTRLVDEDTLAYEAVMAAFALANLTEDDKAARRDAIQRAMKHAAEIPLKVVLTVAEAMPWVVKMAETGNPNCITDAAVGALALEAAGQGAALNVRINLGAIKDPAFVQPISAQLDTLLKHLAAGKQKALELTEAVLKG